MGVALFMLQTLMGRVKVQEGRKHGPLCTGQHACNSDTWCNEAAEGAAAKFDTSFYSRGSCYDKMCQIYHH